MTNKKTIACACFLVLIASSVASAAEWVQTWGAAPLPPAPAMGPFPATPSFENQTIRQIVRVSAGGQRLRIRFTNEYGAQPLAIGAARVALSDPKGNIQQGTERQVLFSGKPSVTIPAAAPFLSDPIDLPIENLASLSISIYLPQGTGPCTCHATGLQDAFVSDNGDFTAKAFEPKQTFQWRAFISGVETEVPGRARAVVVLGDSISDGAGSTAGANRRWPDLLANRLNKEAGPGWGVVNMGISGNRVLGEAAGQNALARFDRDVLSVPGVQTVIIFEGVNDLGLSYGRFEGPMAEVFSRMAGAKVTAESMIAGYRQLIARAHANGLKVLLATIAPYEGATYYSEEGEAVRQAINAWIRTGKEADGVLDFDKAIRDPDQPRRIKEGFHSGDHLHGSDAGYAAMAESIDLALLE